MEEKDTLSRLGGKIMKENSWLKILANMIKRGVQQQPMNSSTEIRLTRLCTQHCRQCSIYDRTTEPPTMSWENFQIISQKLGEYGAHIGFISGGEATLVPHLDKILLEAKRAFLLSTTLVTGLYNKSETIKEIGRLALDNNINIQTSLDGLGELGDHLRGAKDFSSTVLQHMEWLSKNRGNSKSLLYANIVMNDLNLQQVPELIRLATELGWKTTIGMYHSLTPTTRTDDTLQLKPGKHLDAVLNFLENNPEILNLNSYITGISNYVRCKRIDFCAFVDAPVLATRITVMEDGEVHLCWGKSIGNLFQNSLDEIFTSHEYKNRIQEYRSCNGCWTTCYTQRYLLVHPRSINEFIDNIKKVRALKK